MDAEAEFAAGGFNSLLKECFELKTRRFASRSAAGKAGNLRALFYKTYTAGLAAADLGVRGGFVSRTTFSTGCQA